MAVRPTTEVEDNGAEANPTLKWMEGVAELVLQSNTGTPQYTDVEFNEEHVSDFFLQHDYQSYKGMLQSYSDVHISHSIK